MVVGDTASTETRLCPFGFRAAPGWDPATGLGVPRFAALRELLPNLGTGQYGTVNMLWYGVTRYEEYHEDSCCIHIRIRSYHIM